MELHYFATAAAPDIGGCFSADFWTYRILQRCQHDYPVRHAVAALSCVHREYATSSLGEAFKASGDAVEGYGKAMKSLRRFVAVGKAVDRVVVMMCCAAFCCFELISGWQGSALRHLRCGVGVLEEWKMERERTGSVSEDDRSQLVDVFARMDLQASAFDDGRVLTPQGVYSERDTGPEAESNNLSTLSKDHLNAAQYSTLLRQCFNFLIESAPSRRINIDQLCSELLQRRTFLSQLADWIAHLSILERDSTYDNDLGKASTTLGLPNAIARSKFHSSIISLLLQK